MLRPITDPDVLAGYLTDASNLPGRADALLRPRSTEEVGEALAHCQDRGIPVTVTAGRTSTTGGAVPDGGWLLSTERLRDVLSMDRDTARAQGGIFLGAFQQQIERTGRLYPPDPTSRHECTLGASVATNASGARSFRYGPSRRWVRAVQVVLPDGSTLEVTRGDPVPAGWPIPRWSEPDVKTAAGYVPPRDLLDLFVGQEGTLGVITEVEVELTELPGAVIGLVAFFRSRADAVGAMRVLRGAARTDPDGPVSPRCLEYLDAPCLALAQERVGGVPDEAQAALFCEQEVVPGVDEDGHAEAWWDALSDAGALVDDTMFATDGPAHDGLLALRHAIPAGINERVVRMGMPKVGTDLAVPDDALDEMMDLYESAPIEHVLFGHLGDNHLHLNLLPRNAAELERSKEFYDLLARRAVDLGGTVSAEHGIGKLKRRHLAWMVGEATMASFEALKRHLDPRWILGRGNILAAPGEAP